MTEIRRTALVLGCGGQHGEELRAALSSSGADVFFRLLEDCTAQEISQAVIEAEDALGSIDLLAYVGCEAGESRMLLDIDEQEWDSVMNRRLKGFFLSCKCALPYLMGRESSCILLVMPTESRMDECGVHAFAAGAASRAAAVHMAGELANYGIRVRALAAGAGDHWLKEITDGCL